MANTWTEDGYEWGYAADHPKSESRYVTEIKKFIPTACHCKSYMIGYTQRGMELVKPKKFRHVHTYGERS